MGTQRGIVAVRCAPCGRIQGTWSLRGRRIVGPMCSLCAYCVPILCTPAYNTSPDSNPNSNPTIMKSLSAACTTYAVPVEASPPPARTIPLSQPGPHSPRNGECSARRAHIRVSPAIRQPLALPPTPRALLRVYRPSAGIQTCRGRLVVQGAHSTGQTWAKCLGMQHTTDVDRPVTQNPRCAVMTQGVGTWLSGLKQMLWAVM